MTKLNGAAQIRALADEFLMNGVFSIETPIEYGSYSFVPITVEKEHNTTDYLNAAEALETDDLVISEVGDAVESILAKNNSDRPILIEASEVLLGNNSQDRIMLESVILQPGEERRIAVKCVHAPHPLRGGSKFRSMGASGAGLRKSIFKQKYCSVMTDVEHYTPAGAVDQSGVWSDVAGGGQEAKSSDETKYTETLEKKRKDIQKVAEQVREQLPPRTSGLIIINRERGIQAFELYRSSRAFEKRMGFIESILMDKSLTETWPMEPEAAWTMAIQLVYRMREITDGDVIVQGDSDNLHIGFDDLVGEAIVGTNPTSSQMNVLYCTLSTSS
ncbi:MAG: ARPP-1 family domain-containing protein [Candidatus Thorarchaeota archaeon]